MCFAEIIHGSVMFDSNYELCHVNTIAWSDILVGANAATYDRSNNPSRASRQCKYILSSSIFLHSIIYQYF